MIKVEKLKDLDQLLKLWPRLMKLRPEENSEQLLLAHLDCFSHGVVFLCYTDQGLTGSCCVQNVNNNFLRLISMPNDHGTGVTKSCIAAVIDYGKTWNFSRLEVTTTKLSKGDHFWLNGSTRKYYEQSLGFKRHSVTYVKDLWQTEQQ